MTKFGRLGPMTDARRAATLARAGASSGGGGGGGGAFLLLDASNGPVTGRLGITNDLTVGENYTTPSQRITLIEASGTDAAQNYISGDGVITAKTASLTFASVEGDSLGSVGWSSTWDAGVLDNAYSTSDLGYFEQRSFYLVATIANPNIPSGATITGLALDVYRRNTGPYTLNGYDGQIWLRDGTTKLGVDHAVTDLWPAVRTLKTYGGQGDLWGASLTPALINSGTLNIVIQARKPFAAAQAIMQIDYVEVRIYYTSSAAWTTGTEAATGDFSISPGLGLTSGRRASVAADGRLILRSGVVVSSVTKTADYTATAQDYAITANKSTAITITLPAATGTYRVYSVKNIGAGACTVQASGAETIDGANTHVLKRWEAILLLDNGAGTWTVRGKYSVANPFLNVGVPSSATISSGSIAITSSNVKVDTEGGAASDNLDSITGASSGDIVILRSTNAARIVVVVDSATMNLDGGNNMSLGYGDTITLMYDGTDLAWYEIARSRNT